MKSTAVKSTAVKSTAVKTAAVKTAAVKTAAASMRRCAGEVWLAEDSRAQQRGCNAHHNPCLPARGSVVA
jgi:hypothetical protein